MKVRKKLQVILAAALFSCCGVFFGLQKLSAAEEALSTAGNEKQWEASSSAWKDEQKNQPGSQHRRLDLIIGTWDSNVKIWAGDPDAAPLEFTGVTTREWVLGGRFLVERHVEYENNDIIYESVSYLGYNRQDGLFEYLRMSSESTELFVERGRYSSATNSITTSGRSNDPATGFSTRIRTEIKVLGPDNHSRVVYQTKEDGREKKRIEITYTRKKQG